MATALLIVDVQRGMFEDPRYQPHDGAAAVTRMRGLLERARKAEVPIFFVQHDGGAGDPLTAGAPGFPFVDDLTPQGGEEVTVKYECDAFAATDLEEKLGRAGVERLVICGMQTDMCINAAVRSAAARGFGVTLVADAHTTYDTPELPAESIIAQHNDRLRAVAEIIASDDVRFS